MTACTNITNISIFFFYHIQSCPINKVDLHSRPLNCNCNIHLSVLLKSPSAANTPGHIKSSLSRWIILDTRSCFSPTSRHKICWALSFHLRWRSWGKGQECSAPGPEPPALTGTDTVCRSRSESGSNSPAGHDCSQLQSCIGKIQFTAEYPIIDYFFGGPQK